MPRTVHAIIGTAGHIDHGKTALIKALTGRDTDRLKEEKERGISIDLGFAYIQLGEMYAGIVDVPGHERFIRNMLAGAHGMDLVLFVVAADDGVMPQTEEHLDIVHLLGVRRGIVVVTKIDLIDRKKLAGLREDIKVLTLGTVLQGAPVVEVSAVTGEGLEDLRQTMAREITLAIRPQPPGYFRMPVDRAFLIKGHGVVVTGTAIAGEIREGDEVRILPDGGMARVRSIQVHDQSVNKAGWGERVALNLGGIGKGEVERGQVVVDPRISLAVQELDALLEVRPGSRWKIENYSRVRVHLGTVETFAKVTILDGREALGPGEKAYCRLAAKELLAAFPGERLIVRTENATATLGGGLVVNVLAEKQQRRSPKLRDYLEALAHGEPAARAHALLEMHSAFALPLPLIAQGLGLSVEDAAGIINASKDILPLPGPDQPEAFTVKRKWDQARAKVISMVRDFHARTPLAAGIEMESVRSALGTELSTKIFRALVERLVTEKVVVKVDSLLADPTRSTDVDRKDEELLRRIERLLVEGRFAPPDLKRVESAIKVGRKKLVELLALLERRGKVVRVSPDLYFAAMSVDEARKRLVDFLNQRGEITAAQLRDMLGISRKFSIPLLEYFDRSGLTLRVGDVRKLRKA